MRRSPRKFSTEKELYTAAVGGLMRRAYSVFEMRRYLEQRSENPSVARLVLARLQREKLLDDPHYAREFARSRARSRRQGRHRIIRELRIRGLSDANIEDAITETFAETDESAVVRKLIERRLRASRGVRDAKKLASLYRTLLRAGFDAQLIRRELDSQKLHASELNSGEWSGDAEFE